LVEGAGDSQGESVAGANITMFDYFGEYSEQSSDLMSDHFFFHTKPKNLKNNTFIF